MGDAPGTKNPHQEKPGGDLFRVGNEMMLLHLLAGLLSRFLHASGFTL